MSGSDPRSGRKRRPARWRAGLSGVVAGGLLAAGCTGGGEPSAAGAPSPIGGGSGSPASTALASPTSEASPTGSPSTAPTGPAGLSPTATTTGGANRPAGPTTYRLGLRDAGKRLAMEVGDRLEITLTSNNLLSRWTLLTYPRAALRLELSQGTFGRFVFVARAAGSGNVTFRRLGCGTLYGGPCLDASPPIDPPPTTPPPLGSATYTVTVQVA